MSTSFNLSIECKPSNTETPPNIIFILMDDLGRHDVSYKGNQFPSPTIDKLKSHSIELTKHYIHLMCRLIFMLPCDYTEIGGIPPIGPIANWLKETLSHSTYAIGNWHCGYAYDQLLPTSRGFDHFFGFYQGAIHYDNLQYIDIKFGDSDHYDFWEDAQEYSVDD
eukprot:66055_1